MEFGVQATAVEMQLLTCLLQLLLDCLAVIGAIVIIKYLYDSPESEGLPPISQFKNEPEESSSYEKTISSLQVGVLKNPYVWILALSSAFMYVSRYAIESWGIFYLENAKGYTNFQASSILSIYAVMGIVSTVLCGLISDRFFNSNRNKPALFYGIINVIGISILLFYPDSTGIIDTIGVALFGFGTGALITYLGGLMAIDIVSKKASGAAVGVVGIASYIGAGVQDVMSGNLIENSRTVLNGIGSYDFTYVQYFWVGSAVISVILTLFVWNAKPGD